MPGAPRSLPAERKAGFGRKIWLALCAGVFLLSFGYATALGFLKPYTNWDMVAYVGSAISYTEGDPLEIHRKMAEDIKPVVMDWWFRDITEKNALSKTPEHFAQNLPFYTNKPLYVGAVWLLKEAGLTGTYAQATWVIAAVFFAGLAALLLLWRPERMNRGVWLLALVALCWYGDYPLASLARFSTPDSMSMVAMFGALLCILRWNAPWAGIALLVLSILVRPEALIFCGMFAAMCFVMPRAHAPISRLQCVVLAASALVVYFTVQKAVGAYSYPLFFHYVFVHRVPNPAELTDVSISLKQYWGALWWGLQNLHKDSRMIPMLVLSCVAAFCYFMCPKAKRIYPWLLLLSLGNFAVRFVIFPAWGDYRYYMFNHVLIIIAAGEMITPYASALWEKFKKHRAEINVS